MGAISITKLYDLLSVKLGKETAENLTTFIETKINQGLENKIDILATKEDLAKFTISANENFAKFTLANKEYISLLKVDFTKFTLAIKEDIFLLKEDLAKFTLANKEDLSKFKEETKGDLTLLKLDVAGLDAKIKETKGETIKWMFLFWIGQVAVTFGFILLFLKK